MSGSLRLLDSGKFYCLGRQFYFPEMTVPTWRMGGETQPHLGVICVCHCSGRFRALPEDCAIAGICNCHSDSEKYFCSSYLGGFSQSRGGLPALDEHSLSD